MSLVFHLRGDEEMTRYLREFPEAFRGILMLRMRQLASLISARMKEKVSGEVLHIVSGKLRASLYARAYDAKSGIFISFGSRGDVPYAGIQEYGGDVSLPEITPKNKAALLIYGQCKARARAHVVHIPERSYIRSTGEEMSGDAIAAVNAAFDDLAGERP